MKKNFLLILVVLLTLTCSAQRNKQFDMKQQPKDSVQLLLNRAMNYRYVGASLVVAGASLITGGIISSQSSVKKTASNGQIYITLGAISSVVGLVFMASSISYVRQSGSMMNKNPEKKQRFSLMPAGSGATLIYRF